jgi:hypothetical protein
LTNNLKYYHIEKHSKKAVLVFLLLFPRMLYAQYNLVPNPSFEQYTNCPSYGTLSELKNNKPNLWYKPDFKTGIYYNSCSGLVPEHATSTGISYQMPRTGNAYIGVYCFNANNARNYFQVKLLDSLRIGKCYYAECYLSLSNTSKLACNNISMLFTQSPVYADTANGMEIIAANPQVVSFSNPIITDTSGWVKVSGVLIANGNESYLTLGSFRYNNQTNTQIVNATISDNTAFYYIDDVTVFSLDSMPLKADAGEDRTVPFGSSTYIGSYTNGLPAVSWYNSSGAIIATGVPGLTVSLSANTFYVIEQTVCGNYSRDTVYVNVQPLPLTMLSYTVNVTAQKTVHNQWITTNETNVANFNVQRSKDGISFYTIAAIPANNNNYNQYDYTDAYPLNGKSYYRIQSVDKDGKLAYSSVQQVNLVQQQASFVMYPNPATKELHIETTAHSTVQFIDQLGKITITQQLTGTASVINLHPLTSGVYLVRLISAIGTTETKKLLVQ